ncbi:MAG: hypothetical protein PHI12_05110 [Dehalococcoidales bacterium]|nr:hypothetical protein [Dehalococcoidales bacterium]
MFRYASTINGYQYAKDKWNIDCSDLVNSRLDEYFKTGKWRGSFEEQGAACSLSREDTTIFKNILLAET